jgi:lysophospholipase L1-like esterase
MQNISLKYTYLISVTLLLFLFTGCQGYFATESEELNEINPPITGISYLALGDSYTIGQSVATSERWPVQLADTLNEMGYKVENPIIIARTGWTTGNLKNALQDTEIDSTFDLVSLLIGVNNQYRGYSIDTYRNDFRFLLQQAITLAGGNEQRVIILSIPDWSVTPAGSMYSTNETAQEIDQFNAVNREETEKTKAKYINVTPISRLTLDDPSLLAPDLLHPSGKMYREWVKLVVPEVVETLSSISDE